MAEGCLPCCIHSREVARRVRRGEQIERSVEIPQEVGFQLASLVHEAPEEQSEQDERSAAARISEHGEVRVLVREPQTAVSRTPMAAPARPPRRPNRSASSATGTISSASTKPDSFWRTANATTNHATASSAVAMSRSVRRELRGVGNDRVCECALEGTFTCRTRGVQNSSSRDRLDQWTTGEVTVSYRRRVTSAVCGCLQGGAARPRVGTPRRSRRARRCRL